jgi:hypothetical protein
MFEPAALDAFFPVCPVVFVQGVGKSRKRGQAGCLRTGIQGHAHQKEEGAKGEHKGAEKLLHGGIYFCSNAKKSFSQYQKTGTKRDIRMGKTASEKNTVNFNTRIFVYFP